MAKISSRKVSTLKVGNKYHFFKQGVFFFIDSIKDHIEKYIMLSLFSSNATHFMLHNEE